MLKRKLLFSALLMALSQAVFSDSPVFINELHYDNTGADIDEFVEITGPAGTDLSGWQLVFYNGASSQLSPYATNHLSGILSDDTGSGYGFIVIKRASIQNGTPDGLALVDNNGTVVQFLSYEGSFTATSGVASGMTSTDIGVAESPASATGQSLQLQGSGTLDTDFIWVANQNQTPLTLNQGQNLNGSDSGDNGGTHHEFVPIYKIQGASHTSVYEGHEVTTTGVVTATDANGIYVQDTQGDGDEATSDALFVYTGNDHGLQIGDAVRITGTISEYVPGGTTSGNLSITQFHQPDITVESHDNTLPDPILLGRDGRSLPHQIIDDDQFSQFDPHNDGIDFFESLEGMRVRIVDAVAISPTNRFGETFTLTDHGIDASGRNDRGGITLQSDDFNPERIQVDFDRDIYDFFINLNTSDCLGDITGVMGYSYGNYEVYPTQAFQVQSSDLLPEETHLTSEQEYQLTVASYNLLNLDPNDEDGDQDLAEGRFRQIAQDIVNQLQSPDIIGVQEIQDNTGSANDGEVNADLTLQTLVRAIQDAGGPHYEFIDNPPENNQDGGQPGANIRVAFLYNPQNIDLDVTSVTKILDTDLSDGDAFENSRKPLYARFRTQEHDFHLINNHFSSKGGGTPLFGSTQPSVNGGQALRLAQAKEVNRFVASLQTENPDANVIVLGDLNEFSFMPPLTALKGGDKPRLVNMTESLLATERYTYNYQGNSQALDHILVSHKLAQHAQYDIVHLNTEFHDAASDHDPVILHLTMPEGLKTLRFATFNTSLNRSHQGALITDLSTPDDPQAKAVAQIIQHVRPDVLLLNEFDYDEAHEAIKLFARNYLGKPQNGAQKIRYRHIYAAAPNTGEPTGFDLDHDGATDGPGDAQGFGGFPGQYGMVLMSRYPIKKKKVRQFRNFLWKDMPDSLLPEAWYTPDEQAVLKLSSKSHWDIPIKVKGKLIHVLASHPTPPVFDGDEDRNGRRNHDEIRFWLDYISGADYIYDDAGQSGGLSPTDKFVIMGDLNADPHDGDSTQNPVAKLLRSPKVNTSITPVSIGGAQANARQGESNLLHKGGAAFDTADFADESPGNLRTDYVLPSHNLNMIGSGVFWPSVEDLHFNLVGDWPFPSSDHRLVWIDMNKKSKR
jgi:predicted extracellular nuclease